MALKDVPTAPSDVCYLGKSSIGHNSSDDRSREQLIYPEVPKIIMEEMKSVCTMGREIFKR